MVDQVEPNASTMKRPRSIGWGRTKYGWNVSLPPLARSRPHGAPWQSQETDTRRDGIAAPDLLPERPPSATGAATEFEPLFELGGPAYRLMQRIGLIKGAGPSVIRRSIAFVAITWLPMLAFSIFEGSAVGLTPRTSLLLDFATYARFFVATPLIFAAEALVGPRIRAAGLRFLHGGIIADADRPAFHAAVSRARRRRDAALPELLFMLFGFFGAWFLTIEQLGGVSSGTWHALWTAEGMRLTAAGLWYQFVAIPLVQFFILRWVWRVVIWTLFLREMSRLRLRLFATHADGAAGLGFLGLAHVPMAVFPFASSWVLAAELAFRVQFEGMNLAGLRAMTPVLIAYLVFVEAVTFGPLLILTPLLVSVRREGLRSYGILVQWHNELFHEKWVAAERRSDDPPLGNSDMSSLIDLGSSFTVIQQMRVFCASRSQLIQVAAIACLPALPLALLVLPFMEVMKLLAGIVV